MKIKYLLSFLLPFILFYSTQAQRMKPANPELRERLVKYAAENYLPASGLFMFWDSVSKQPYRFSASTFFVEEMPEPSSVVASLPSQTNNVLTGGNFHLVQDINTATDASVYTNLQYGFYPTYAVLDNSIYFIANDGIHGAELWKSDGTADGTKLVKDITAGESSSYTNNLTTVGANVYFSLFTSDSQYQIWKTDGTEAGTLKVTTLTTARSTPPYFCGVGNSLYFTLSSIYQSDQLWKTDGTEQSTVMVKDFSSEGGANNSSVRSLVSSNGLLFFVGVTKADGAEMWRSNGTDTGTYRLKNISPFTDTYNAPGQLTPYDNKVYFSEYDSTYRNKLWVTDGTTSGTTVVPGYNGVYISNIGFESIYDNEPFVISKGIIYCTAGSEVLNSGIELFTYDIANPLKGLTLVKDITPNGNTNIYREQIADVEGTVYFTFQDTDGWHLYKTMGTENTTFKVKDVPQSNRLTGAGGKLYFFAGDSIHGTEPWISDGTAEGTTILKDIYPGVGTSSPEYITSCNGKVLFKATDDSHGSELWGSNGNTAQIVKDINTITNSGSNPYDFAFLGNKALFVAGTYALGDELWSSDGGNGAAIVKDINPGQGRGYDEYTNRHIVKNNSFYFIGTNSNYTSSQGGGEVSNVFKSDGSSNGTVRLSRGTGRVEDFAVTDDNTVFYIFFNYENFLYELWKTNGTSEGSIRLRSGLDIDFSNSFYQRIIVAVGNSVYFSARDKAGTNGYELWKSDGTEAGTAMLKDINTTTSTANSNPARLISFNNQLFFSANDGSEKAFWTTNGTESGTLKVKSVVPNAYAISDGTLFFSGSTTDAGTELWKSDGTSLGTVTVKDIYTGTGSSSPANLTDVNGILYFTAAANALGNELWKSDGTTAGTQLVKDITAGAGSSSLLFFTVAAGKLFFEFNYKLWTSDGTASGTGEIADESLNNILVYNLAGNGNQLYIAGYTYKYGIELYVGDAAQTILPAVLTSFNASLKNSDVITQWQTASEINTSYFNVQRSTDGIHFTDAGKLTAKGTGSTYTFTDVNIANLVSAKTIYYRLQIVDNDGSTSLSKVAPVNLNLKEAVVLLLPNPVKDKLRIRVNNYSGKASIGVFDASGKNVYSIQQEVQNGNDFIINTPSLPSGVYMVKVILNGRTIQQKFIKE